MLKTIEICAFEEFGRHFVFDVNRQAVYATDSLKNEILSYCSTPREAGQIVGEFARRFDRGAVESALNFLAGKGILMEEPDIETSFDPHYQPFSDKFNLTLNLTHACNLRCKYCYVEKTPVDAESSFMTAKTAMRAVDFVFSEFNPTKGVGISFYGGEPLLNFSVMKETMEYATTLSTRKGLPEVDFHFNTNGTLLTEPVINYLRDFNVNVQVSIDGDCTTHDSMRVFSSGRGSHSIIMANLKKLMSANGRHRVSVSGVVTHNGRLKDAYEYLSKFDFKDIKLSYVRYLENCEYALTDTDKAIYVEDMKRIAEECLGMILEGRRPPAYNFETKILQLWSGARRQFFCPAGVTRFGISPEGGIYPCGPAAAMGVMKMGSLDTGLDREKREKVIQGFSLESSEGCRSCWARYLCAGGCPLPLVRTYDNDCKMALEATKLAIAIFALIREKNELLLSCLVDPSFLQNLKLRSGFANQQSPPVGDPVGKWATG